MDIVNGTNEDAKVKVSGGGSGIAPQSRPFEDENFADWPSLPPGGLLRHSPLPPGPWTVCFVVNGHRVLGEARSGSSKITLTPAGSAFRIKVE
ncbi:MAG TPA: hypothetical protein VHC97_07835 [Thermoanaerobaculia bacterium]|jgi:hypothetical protein|nr:hypothetical protein [Thermoanaerobaculia bacterium]